MNFSYVYVVRDEDTIFCVFTDSVQAQDYVDAHPDYWWEKKPLDPGLTLCQLTGDGSYQPYFPGHYVAWVAEALQSQPTPEPQLELPLAAGERQR